MAYVSRNKEERLLGDLELIDKVSMHYKEGKPWTGDILEVHGDWNFVPVEFLRYHDERAYITKERHYIEGKLTGRYVETGIRRGTDRDYIAEMAHFKDGILDGEYQAYTHGMSGLKFIKSFKKVPNLKKSVYNEIKGSYNRGVFSGSIKTKRYRNVPYDSFTIKNGQLTCSIIHMEGGVVIRKDYENGKLVLFEKHNKSQMIERREYKTKGTNDESKATKVMLGISGAVAAVSVASYMASVYPSKEKAPEDKKVAPQEVKANQAKLNADEAKMFNLALNSPSAEFKAFMEHNKDKININATNENGETVLMSALANDKLENAEYILEKFGDKIEYKARTNDGVGYQEIMKARLHSPNVGAKDLKINRLIKEGVEKENQQIKQGKARTTDSYAFYDQMKSKTKE